MEIDEEMVLSMVKEQLNHYRIKKVSDEECKNLLAWWKVHESYFSYVGFVAWQILGIVGSQIEAEKVFKIVSICINTRQFRLGIIFLEMLVSIYKE